MKRDQAELGRTEIKLPRQAGYVPPHQKDVIGFYVESAYALQVTRDLAEETHPSDAHRNAITTASLVYHAMTGDKMDRAVQNVIAMVPHRKAAKGMPAGR